MQQQTQTVKHNQKRQQPIERGGVTFVPTAQAAKATGRTPNALIQKAR